MDLRLKALIEAGDEMAGLLRDAEETHIYDFNNGDEHPDDCAYCAARTAWRLAKELGDPFAPETELPPDVAEAHDKPNAHGVAWIATWRSGGASGSNPVRSFTYARAWLVRAAARHGETIPEGAIPLEPDAYVGWSWETLAGRKYAIRSARTERATGDAA